MNIFFLNRNPKIAAKWHCQAHASKMITESAQMLSTALRMQYNNKINAFVDGEMKTIHTHPTDIITKNWMGRPVLVPKLYLDCYHSHPCNIEIRRNRKYFDYLYILYKHLCIRYFEKTGKKHKSSFLLDSEWGSYFLDFVFESDLRYNIDLPLAMPDELKTDCVVKSYQSFYVFKLKNWSNGTKKQKQIFRDAYSDTKVLPFWLNEHFYLDDEYKLKIIEA